jgi:peroxiredoxin
MCLSPFLQTVLGWALSAFFLLAFTASNWGCRARVVDLPTASNDASSAIVDGHQDTSRPDENRVRVEVPTSPANNDSERPLDTARPPEPEPPREFRIDPEEAAKVYQPVVVLSAQHAQSCLLKVGDDMPAATLQDLEGAARRLRDFYGDRLTLVVFWNQETGREQFTRLDREITDEFAGSGLEVVAVNVGDSAEDVRQLAEEFDVSAARLLDENGDAFRRLATAKLPRTYLLDAAGKIVWFDIEYSRDMRRELRNAILYFLQRERNADPAG